MKKYNHMGMVLLSILFITFLLVVTPSVLGGSFRLEVYPSQEPISPGVELKEVFGFAEYVGGPFNPNALPFWQFTVMEVKSKPDWATVILPTASLLSPPTGVRENFSIFVGVSEEAPAYEYGSVSLSIRSGPFWRMMLGMELPYNLDTDFSVQAGYLPLLSITLPPPIEGMPNSFIYHKVQITNSGNAPSEVTFKANTQNIPEGWAIQTPPARVIGTKATEEVAFVVTTPNRFGYIDEWVPINIDVQVTSVLGGATRESKNYTVSTLSHCVGYYVPNLGNNPSLIFGLFGAIVIFIIILIVLIVRVVLRRKPINNKINLKEKINLRRKKEKK